MKQIYGGGMVGDIPSRTEVFHYCNPQREIPTHSFVKFRYEHEQFIFEFKTESKYGCPKK